MWYNSTYDTILYIIQFFLQNCTFFLHFLKWSTRERDIEKERKEEIRDIKDVEEKGLNNKCI